MAENSPLTLRESFELHQQQQQLLNDTRNTRQVPLVEQKVPFSNQKVPLKTTRLT